MSTLDEELTELMQTRVNPDLSDTTEGDDQLIAFMSKRIEELMAGEFESLMSMMYRLDVDERKIRNALSPMNPENPATSLARLIVLRQKREWQLNKNTNRPRLMTG
ncbi:MAG: hypothetical protein IPL46_26970 [Saprospiraceae bacterium]|nr:hypothetical protein [Saprospiraceae bacterium]